MSGGGETKNGYTRFLPAIFSGGGEQADFFARLLKVFEKVLTGIDDDVTVGGKEIKGISETIDGLPGLFSPFESAPEFNNWLASATALVLKENWTEQKKKEIISTIIPLYRMRGTKRGLQEYLNIFIEGGAKVYDDFTPFQVGVNCKVGVSTVFSEYGIPNYFSVEATLSEVDPEARNRRISVIKSIVEREKPVHTDYTINFTNVASMQVGVYSRVGIDTLVWNNE